MIKFATTQPDAATNSRILYKYALKDIGHDRRCLVDSEHLY